MTVPATRTYTGLYKIWPTIISSHHTSILHRRRINTTTITTPKPHNTLSHVLQIHAFLTHTHTHKQHIHIIYLYDIAIQRKSTRVYVSLPPHVDCTVLPTTTHTTYTAATYTPGYTPHI